MNVPTASPAVVSDIDATSSPFKYGNDSFAGKPPTDMSIDQSILDDTKSNNKEGDTLQKLKDLEILPDLFNLLIDLSTGTISAKDFENNAGSIRLKLSKLKQYLKEVDGINETLQARNNKITYLEESINKKRRLLESFKKKVEEDIAYI